ncbi:hypothetical protein ACS0TY_026295 [Phlomoides rotata]
MKLKSGMALSNSPFLLLLLLSLFLANRVQSQTSFHIDSFYPNSDGLTYERDAFVPDGTRYLSLVATGASGKAQNSSVGRVLYSNPVKLWDEGQQASFETTIKFAISPVNKYPAGGMTFFIVPVNSTQPTGGEGGDFGIFGAVTEGSPIFAIEFGAYVNSIRIGINSKVSQNAIFRYPIGEIMTVGITYDALSRITTLVGTYGSQTSKFPFGYDMKVHSLLPQQVQVGLSASTGLNHACNFNVFSWDFASSMVTDIYD